MFESRGIFNLLEIKIKIVIEGRGAWLSLIYYISYTTLNFFSKYSIGYKLLLRLVFIIPKDYQQYTIMIKHMLIWELYVACSFSFCISQKSSTITIIILHMIFCKFSIIFQIFKDSHAKPILCIGEF
jgi:hypothetical protein